MTKVIPFKIEHVECMEIREYESMTTINLENWGFALKKFEQSKTCGTILHDGRILAVMGYYELWPGVCELFVLPSKYLPEYPIQFARCVRRTLNSGIFKEYHRVQIHALDDDLHNRWLSFLKFSLEGVLKKYDSKGNDYKIWARYS